MRWFSEEMLLPEVRPRPGPHRRRSRCSRPTRGSAHAFVNWQTKQQLDVEYALNARATILDRNTVRAAGRTFTARKLVSREGAQPLRRTSRAVALTASTSGSSIQANSAGPASTRAWTREQRLGRRLAHRHQRGVAAVAQHDVVGPPVHLAAEQERHQVRPSERQADLLHHNPRYGRAIVFSAGSSITGRRLPARCRPGGPAAASPAAGPQLPARCPGSRRPRTGG
jgi:hypothetical protein